MGREVTVVEPEREPDGFFPKGPASVCLEGPPQRQCYSAPQEFGNNPAIVLVELKKDMPALLFSAASAGVSGWGIHFALLRPGTGKDLRDLFPSGILVSNQSESAFWNEPALFDSQIFVTADYFWGPNEGHLGEHRYIISAYVLKPSSIVGDLCYNLAVRFTTNRAYDLESERVLASEKKEILTRLTLLKAEAGPRRPTPH